MAGIHMTGKTIYLGERFLQMFYCNNVRQNQIEIKLTDQV